MTQKPDNIDTPQGLAFVIAAYFLWGFLPLYMKALSHVPAAEVVAHRVVWSVPVAALVLIALKRTKELRAVQGELVQAGKLSALGQMSAGISHELNQPLAAMKTYLAGAKLLLQRKRPDEAQSSFQRIDDLIERMGLGSEEELSERVKTMLEQRAEQNQKADMYQQACDQLVDGVELELPAGISSRQTERVLQRQMMDMMYRGTPQQEAEQQMAEKQFGQMEAIINSMTPKERRSPDVLNGSRKRRITRGSGTQIADLNRLLKQHKQMQKMMKKMKKKGGMANMMRGLGGMGGGMDGGVPPGLR